MTGRSSPGPYSGGGSGPAMRTSARPSSGSATSPNPSAPRGGGRSSGPSSHAHCPTRRDCSCGTSSRRTSSSPCPLAGRPTGRTTRRRPWHRRRRRPSPARPAANPCYPRRCGVSARPRSWRCPVPSPRPRRSCRRIDCPRWRWSEAGRASPSFGPSYGASRGSCRGCRRAAIRQSTARRCSWAGSPPEDSAIGSRCGGCRRRRRERPARWSCGGVRPGKPGCGARSGPTVRR